MIYIELSGTDILYKTELSMGPPPSLFKMSYLISSFLLCFIQWEQLDEQEQRKNGTEEEKKVMFLDVML